MFNLAKETQIAMIPWWLALAGVLGSVILGGSRLFPSNMGLKTKTNRRRDKEVKGHKIIANIKKKPERYKKQKS